MDIFKECRINALEALEQGKFHEAQVYATLAQAEATLLVVEAIKESKTIQVMSDGKGPMF